MKKGRLLGLAADPHGKTMYFPIKSVGRYIAFTRLSHFLKRLMFKIKRPFYCDSHVNLCRNCIMLRFWLLSMKIPKHLYIFTAHGTYYVYTQRARA